MSPVSLLLVVAITLPHDDPLEAEIQLMVAAVQMDRDAKPWRIIHDLETTAQHRTGLTPAQWRAKVQKRVLVALVRRWKMEVLVTAGFEYADDNPYMAGAIYHVVGTRGFTDGYKVKVQW